MATQGDLLMAAKARNQLSRSIKWNEDNIRLAEEEAVANPRMKIDEPKTRRDPTPGETPPLGYSEAMRRYHESQAAQGKQ